MRGELPKQVRLFIGEGCAVRTVLDAAQAMMPGRRHIISLAEKSLGGLAWGGVNDMLKAVDEQDVGSGGADGAEVDTVAQGEGRDFIKEHFPSTGAEARAAAIFPDDFAAARAVGEDHPRIVAEIAELMFDRNDAELRKLNEIGG